MYNMNSSQQNFLKITAIVLMALGIVTIPADLPYAAIVTILFELSGTIGYALAHYAADPTALPEPVVTSLKDMADEIECLKKASANAMPPQQVLQGLDPAQVAADLQEMYQSFQQAISEITAKYPLPAQPSRHTTADQEGVSGTSALSANPEN